MMAYIIILLYMYYICVLADLDVRGGERCWALNNFTPS